MEPTFFNATLNLLALVFGGPFVAFGFGVLICDQLKLHSLRKRRHLWMISLPVALLTVGTMVSSTKIESAQGSVISVKYAHVTALDQYLMFLGITIIFGTMAPTSFDRIRDKLLKGGPVGTLPADKDQ